MKAPITTLCIFLLGVFPALANGPITTGVDITGQTQVTASQLLQMVNQASMTRPYGVVIRTNAAPANTNYLWLDISTTPAALKAYQTGSWVSASISAGSIDTTALGGSAVTSAKIAASAVQTTNVANNAIDQNKLAALSVGSSHYQLASVSNMHLATRTIEGGYSGAIGLATITHTNLAANTALASIGAGGITASYLASGSVTTAALSNNAVSDAKMVANTLTTNSFSSSVNGQLIKAWANVDAAGALVNGYGVATATRFAVGKYIVSWSATLPTTNYCVVVTPLNAVGFLYAQAITNTTASVTVVIAQPTGPAAADPTHGFSVQLIY